MKKIALIYTGGTIGMQANAQGQLAPVHFEDLRAMLPAMDLLPGALQWFSLEEPVDSSNMTHRHWVELVELVEENYHDFDGFVVLHGSDTMAYTASALSFMIRNLDKPIILTGSQLPLGVLRTDAVENLITSVELALQSDASGAPLIQEVAIYFEYTLLRGNRAYKRSSNEFNAFSSPNYPALLESGVKIKVNKEALLRPKGPVSFHKAVSNAVGVITLYPGLDWDNLTPLAHWQVVLLRSFGAGNVQNTPAFSRFLTKCQEKNIVVLNSSQCVSGAVLPGEYESSAPLDGFKVLGINDMTFEAALVKAMVILGELKEGDDFAQLFGLSLAGEVAQ